jgi:uncharacterized protein (TIGR03086 family)
MELIGTFLVAQKAFGERVHAVGPDQWLLATPDSEWSVSDLIRHLVDEHRWAAPLLAGLDLTAAAAAVAELGPAGPDGAALVRDWDRAAAASAQAFRADGALRGAVAITRGTVPAEEYLEEMILDLVVHAWDLGVAIGYPVRLPADAVRAIYPLAQAIVDRTPRGMFAPPVQVRAGASPVDRLVALTGRQPAARFPAGAIGWMRDGTALLISQAADLDEAALAAPSGLPGWSRRHLVAHLAANAEALGNLAHWAATGEATPMYASAQERADGIEAGVRRPTADLAAWLHDSASQLAAALDGLSAEQWQAKVKTAQGRTVPATQVPWMRSREVYVHSVDLVTGVGFGDLPARFLSALCDDIIAKRAPNGAALPGDGPALVLVAADTGDRWELPGPGVPVTMTGPLAEITAYLAGRPHTLRTADGTSAPALSPWL